MYSELITNVILSSTISVLMISSTQFVYAGGPERDYDEAYEDIPGANECWYDGYADGQDHPFNHDRNEKCIDGGCQYLSRRYLCKRDG